MVFKKSANKRSFYKKKEEEHTEEDVGQEEEEEVEDVGQESDHEDKVSTKKQKTSTSTSSSTASSKSSSSKPSSSKSSSSKSSSNEKSIELGGKRKIQYSEFGGAPKIDIREFYEDKSTGELKPGSKGISLTFEQFQVIADNIDTIVSWTKKK